MFQEGMWVEKGTNYQGPKEIWVPKKLVLFFRNAWKPLQTCGILISGCSTHLTEDINKFSSSERQGICHIRGQKQRNDTWHRQSWITTFHSC